MQQRNDGPEVINVRAAELRKHGFQSLEQWLQDPNHVYIGRANPHVRGAHQSKWHNPFPLHRYGREGCIREYEKYILKNDELLSQLPELKGKVLGCWCAPETCHGHVLSRLVRERVDNKDIGQAAEEEHAGAKHKLKNTEASEQKTAEDSDAANSPAEKPNPSRRRRRVKLASTA